MLKLEGGLLAKKRRGRRRGNISSTFLVEQVGPLQVECIRCGFRKMDPMPAFWRTDPRFYVTEGRRVVVAATLNLRSNLYKPSNYSTSWIFGHLKKLVKPAKVIIKAYNEWAKRQTRVASIALVAS